MHDIIHKRTDLGWVVNADELENFKNTKLIRRTMKEHYKEEFEDLIKVYEEKISDTTQQVLCFMPTFLTLMKQFIELHEQGQEYTDKLDTLRDKLGLNTQDDNQEEE